MAQRAEDFLLEIGCEELPADSLPGALDWDYPQSRGLASAVQRFQIELEEGQRLR